MNTLSKLAIVGAFGALFALTPSSDGARAQVYGMGVPGTVRVVRHWHPGRWHGHAVAPIYTTGYMAPTTGLFSPLGDMSNDARGIAFVFGGLAGPAAFLFATP
ncbi:MAG: hypothetical protein HYS06_07970 [Methylocystis sp.]|nr:hypothetical protein [Methylocystis sp.]